jgi:polar amino acid transport system substrate-binding protein
MQNMVTDYVTTSSVVKKWIVQQVCYAGLLIAFTVPIHAMAESQSITFESTESPPYWSAALPEDGLGGAILKLLSEKAGFQYTIEYLPPNRFHVSLNPYMLGDPDFLKNQQQRAVIPIGIFRSAIFFYKPHHEAMVINSLKDLSGHTLGVLRGTLEDKATFERQGIKIEEGNSEESLLKMLKKGRVDLCILVAGTGRYTVDRTFPAEKEAFVQTVIPSLTRPLAIIINTSQPQEKAIAQRYRQVLNQVLQSEQYHAILEKHYGKGQVPSDRDEKLNQFIQYYANTGNE